MKIDVLTLFPEMFKGPFDESIVKRARDAGLIEINIYDIRAWTDDKRRTVDDKPFGGGPGMVMKPEPLFKALDDLENKGKPDKVILLCPRGRKFDQDITLELSGLDHLILICGHYEGIDERVRKYLWSFPFSGMPLCLFIASWTSLSGQPSLKVL
ncbi:MAG: hypothetical protein KAX15_03420, partial [Candidatus Omnitrophica bacterium]|nr:hypothetical protein [Candidatus Omnitrophota bacterium]